MGRIKAVELKQILHLKVGCLDFGPVRDRGSLPYRAEANNNHHVISILKKILNHNTQGNITS